MSNNKINSIIQFIETSDGRKITLVTNPLQAFANKRDKGHTGFTCWCYMGCTLETSNLIKSTKKSFPQYFQEIIYV